MTIDAQLGFLAFALLSFFFAWQTSGPKDKNTNHAAATKYAKERKAKALRAASVLLR